MKTSHLIKLTAIGLAGLLTACSTSTPEVSRIKVSANSQSQGNALADRVFRDVNQYRASKGRSAVERHYGLDVMAQKHCDYLAARVGKDTSAGKSINHNGFEGRALVARHKYRISTIGENVVTSTNHSSKHLVGLWAESEMHEHNMRSKWKYTGVATATSPNGLVICTQIFAAAPQSKQYVSLKRRSGEW